MNRLLLAAAPVAALIILSTPAVAASSSGGSAASVTVHHGFIGRGTPELREGAFACQQRSGRHFDRHDRRHGHDFDDDCGFFDGGLGYLDPGDYDANRSFNPDLWNDWWHERPNRAYPRWVQQNQNCTADRMWWSGSGWHC